MWTNFVYGLGDFFYATFKILPKLGNIPNAIFVIIGITGLAIWMKKQKDYDEIAEREGTIK